MFDARTRSRPYWKRASIESGGGCYEILNFAVYGYNPLFQIGVLKKVAAFQPKAILYVAHPEDSDRVVRFLAQSIRERKALPYDELTTLVQGAGRRFADARARDHPAPDAARRPDSFVALPRIVDDSQRAGMAAGYIFLPMVPEMQYSSDVTRQIEMARRSGFVVLDLSDVYVGSDRHSLWIAEWDAHPNAAGHRLIADHLYPLFQQNRERLVGSAGDPRLRAAR